MTMPAASADSGSSRPMARAFELARSVLGWTSPNPAVGAVVVRHSQIEPQDDRIRIVGEGATQPPGGAHAEVMALREAGAQARGATLYVTLEPCAHHGRTPPCTDALVSAGIAEVVVACLDPDPQVAGRGLEQLRAAGITVSLGDGAAQAASHYEPYQHHRRTGRPFVVAKFAASLDGRIAATSGDSRWISGPQTLAWAHQNRPHFDAILVGVGTILVDNPQLTARPQEWRGPVPQPLRVVLDSRGRTPLDARVLEGLDTSPTLIATTEAAPAEWRTALEARGVRVAVLPAEDGHVALQPLLDHLGQQAGVIHLLVEGGGEVLGACFDQRLIDKVHAVVAPILIGGDAQTAVRGRGAERMRDALRLSGVGVERLGDDLLITGYPTPPEHELKIRLRPAGPTDAAAIDELLTAAQLPPLAATLLEEARRSQAIIWLAVSDNSPDTAIGIAALRLPTGADTAELVCLILRAGAPTSTAERLREASEASARGRECQWIVAPRQQTANLNPSIWNKAGYRYYRKSANGADTLIKLLGE